MNAPLPDTARHIMPFHSHTLDWVGMENIRLPLRLDAGETTGEIAHVTASADIGIDLPGGEDAKKGIHMSRLYRALLDMSQESLTLNSLRQCLQACITSHEDCRSEQSALTLKFDLLLQREALLTREASGWQSYGVILDARANNQGSVDISVGVEVDYSSTCPCSAALSRQALSDAFSEAYGDKEKVNPLEISQWLLQHGSLATPHSQRSTAKVTVSLQPEAENFGICQLIDELEDALQTPVQTFVKRQDEQAFALRNGANLMYVEDASRRILDAVSHYPNADVQVRHFESLHGHDAVAKSQWRQGEES